MDLSVDPHRQASQHPELPFPTEMALLHDNTLSHIFHFHCLWSLTHIHGQTKWSFRKLPPSWAGRRKRFVRYYLTCMVSRD